MDHEKSFRPNVCQPQRLLWAIFMIFWTLFQCEIRQSIHFSICHCQFTLLPHAHHAIGRCELFIWFMKSKPPICVRVCVFVYASFTTYQRSHISTGFHLQRWEEWLKAKSGRYTTTVKHCYHHIWQEVSLQLPASNNQRITAQSTAAHFQHTENDVHKFWFICFRIQLKQFLSPPNPRHPLPYTTQHPVLANIRLTFVYLSHVLYTVFLFSFLYHSLFFLMFSFPVFGEPR